MENFKVFHENFPKTLIITKASIIDKNLITDKFHEFMAISMSLRLIKKRQSLLYLTNQMIKATFHFNSSVNFLDVLLDENLTWVDHITAVEINSPKLRNII